MIVVSGLVVIGLLVAAFVGYNIGGSSTGVAFGPAVGGKIVNKTTAASLFTLFALVGGWTVGRNVITTMSEGIVPQQEFTLLASIVVLFFTGATLLLSNIYGVPASTSMTAVGSIAGLGLATGTLNESMMFGIVAAWIIAPVAAFWIGFLFGRYLYPHLDARVSFTRFEAGLVTFERTGMMPRVSINERAHPRDIVGAAAVLIVACYNAFSAGASNAANAIAPLVGSGSLTASQGIILAIAAIGLGGFTIARRTLDTVGDGLTDLPILAALVVSLVGATIITVLSDLGIPASLAVSTTSSIIGLGWGRSSRHTTLVGASKTAIDTEPTLAVRSSADRARELSTNALLAETAEPDPETERARGPTIGELATEPDIETRPLDPDSIPRVGEESQEDLLREPPVMFDRVATQRVVFLWILTPTLATIGSWLVFSAML